MSVTAEDARDSAVQCIPPVRRRRTDDSGGMHYLESIPKRLVTLYLPLGVFVFVLLFPFYWMTITAFKSNEELLNYRDFNPLLVANPTFANIRKLLFETSYPGWLWNTMVIAVAMIPFLLAAILFSYFGLQRRRWQQGGGD